METKKGDAGREVQCTHYAIMCKAWSQAEHGTVLTYSQVVDRSGRCYSRKKGVVKKRRDAVFVINHQPRLETALINQKDQSHGQDQRQFFRLKRFRYLSVLEGDLTLDAWLLAYCGDDTVDAVFLVILFTVSPTITNQHHTTRPSPRQTELTSPTKSAH